MTANSVTNYQMDVVASLLRAQIDTLEALLKNIEQKNPIDEYTDENLKRVEKSLRWLRKYSLNID